MEARNAVIECVDIGKRRFIGKGSVIVARIVLGMGDSPNQSVTVELPDDCVGQWLQKFFETVGIGSLWQGNGKAVRLKIGATLLEGQIRIGHIVKDVWFNPYDLREDPAA